MAISEYIRTLREHIGHATLIVPSVTALIFDRSNRVLLHRSTDDNRWHTIGGAIEPGEDPAAAVIREAREETGLTIKPRHVSGVYTRPPMTYSNGDTCIYVTIAFKCEVDSGILKIDDDESIELKYFAHDELPELIPAARLEVEHGFQNSAKAWFKVTDAESIQ
jgi:8-oxo-dGTP pyrophosphatase MutT (NUDIX family)